jgi:hypothetical protein
VSDLSREAREIIDAARGADDPTPHDQQRVRSALYAQLGIPAAGIPGSTAAGSTAASTAASSALILKLVLSAILIGALATAGYLWLGGSDDHRPNVAAQSSVHPEPAAPEAPNVSKAPVEASVHPEPAAPEAPRVSKAPAAAKPPRKSRTPSSSLEDLLAEKALIDAARRALASANGGAALEALDQHASEFPRGQLASERAGTRVLALCELGRTADARREAGRFLARYPQHPMTARVRSSCAQ